MGPGLPDIGKLRECLLSIHCCMLPGKADSGIHSLPAEAVTPADTVGNLMILIAVRQSSIDDRVGTGSFIEPEYMLYRPVSVQRRFVNQHVLCTLSPKICAC